MKAIELKVYEILKTRFSEKEAETFIEYFDQKTIEKIDDKKDVFLIKEDKIDLIEKMNKDKIDLIKWMFGFWITIVLLLLANWFIKQ
jgi:excinuclease UvrABC helicase subunit UvrB